MIRITNGRIVIPGDRLDRRQKSSLPGVRFERGYWYMFATPANVAAVNSFLGENLLPPPEPKIAYPFRTVPFAHQLSALAAGADKPAFAYLMEQGTGKTKVLIDNAELLHRDGRIDRVLIVCPKTVIGTWHDEIKKHGHVGSIWGGDGMSIHITNIDQINTDHGYKAAYLFLMEGNALFVVDESTSIKNMEAKRTQRVMQLARIAAYRRILTGTPVGNVPLDLYAQFHFLDPEIFFGWSWFAFRSHFAIMGGYKNKEVVGYQNQDELAGIIAPFSFRVTKDQCLDLPPKVYEVRRVELGKVAIKMYERVCTDIGFVKSMIKFKNRDPRIPNVVTALNQIVKLRQVTGGFMIIEGKPKRLDDGKIEATLEIVRESAGKAIVWCQFTHEVAAVREALNKEDVPTVEISGRVAVSTRVQAIRDFETGCARVIVCQLDAGSQGTTLNQASTVVFYSNPDRYMTRIQAEDRCHRAGQTKSVTYFDLVVPGTVDVTMQAARAEKKDLSDFILDAVRDSQSIESVVRGGNK